MEEIMLALHSDTQRFYQPRVRDAPLSVFRQSSVEVRGEAAQRMLPHVPGKLGRFAAISQIFP